MEEYDTYLENLEQKLRNNGFEVKRKIPIPPYQLDLLAVKTSSESLIFGLAAYFILVTSMNKVNTETLRDFSSASTKYAFDNCSSTSLPRLLGGGLLAFPVAVSEDFQYEVKKWMENTLAKKHLRAVEFPVIVSLKEKKIYYCKKTRIYAAAYYPNLRKLVEKLLSF